MARPLRIDEDGGHDLRGDRAGPGSGAKIVWPVRSRPRSTIASAIGRSSVGLRYDEVTWPIIGIGIRPVSSSTSWAPSGRTLVGQESDELLPAVRGPCPPAGATACR